MASRSDRIATSTPARCSVAVAAIVAWSGGCIPAQASDEAQPSRLDLRVPSVAETAAIAAVLGTGFQRGSSAFPARMEVASLDLDADGADELITAQFGLCSNHACTFHVLTRDGDGEWRQVGEMESWAIPFVGPAASPGSMRNLVIFDHSNEDCSACSSPRPVRMTYRNGGYVRDGVVRDDTEAYVPAWGWMLEGEVIGVAPDGSADPDGD